MSQKNYFVLVLIMLFTSASLDAYAWDGKRQGFLLGLGAGVGQLSYENVQYDKVSSYPIEDDTSALAFMPKLGYAFTNQLALIYSRHPFLFEATDSDNKRVSLTTCVESLELHYYFSSDTPTLYFGVGAGNSHLFKDDLDEPGALNGSGSMATIGIEFFKHYSIEITYTTAIPQTGAKVTGIALTLSALGY